VEVTSNGHAVSVSWTFGQKASVERMETCQFTRGQK